MIERPLILTVCIFHNKMSRLYGNQASEESGGHYQIRQGNKHKKHSTKQKMSCLKTLSLYSFQCGKTHGVSFKRLF